MTALRNSLIKASAGTGKTFALATRMLRLMLLGVEPDQIVALTFSRAAAGEIFNRIAGRLADAATSDSLASRESAHVFHELDPVLAEAIRSRHGPSVPRAAFAALLRRLIATQHTSMVGTIDSFMTRMVQAFPLELGLQGSLTIMEDYRVEREKDAAITSLLSRFAEGREAELFFDAFRQATFGREGKSFSDKLASFVASWHGTLLDYPDPRSWGDPAVIWPGGAPFGLHGTVENLAERLRAELRDDWAAQGRENTWDEFCDFVAAFNTSFSEKAAVKNVLSAYRPGATSIEVSYNRKAICFTGEKARLILQTVETLYGLVVLARCQSTQGIYGLMKQIESAYAQNTRSRGLLTFDDIPRLIAGLDDSIRQNIEFRFDSRFNHWALDEFQDTSRAQWTAIRNLVDEVIQSDGDARSLFIVGDMKQAIYGWRGGDVAIFEREADSGHYAIADLNTSYRYCPQIADLVNRVFEGGRIAALLAPSAPEAGERWRRLWGAHSSTQPDGFVSVERVPAPDKEADESPLDPYLQAACRHLLAVRPWERGLSAAVLVRTNDHGLRFANALRQAGVPAVWEGESAICDTPAVTALLHLLKVAEHPGDTLAWRHVCASPLARSVFRDACSLPDEQGTEALSRRVLDDVSRLGLPRTLQAYIDALAGTLSDAFTRTRLDELVRAAARFAVDADATATLTDFGTFAEAFLTRDVADTSTVKILTIHRSKGLGFDFVLLPIIETAGIDATRAGDALFAADDTWLLTNPGSQVVQADATLAAARASTDSNAVFEALCVYYVSMTRAKRALTLLLRPPSKRGTDSLYFSDHIEAALGVSLPWTAGAADWFERAGPAQAGAVETAPPLPALARAKRRALRRVTPSSTVCYGRAASELFSPRDGLALERGTRLHDALSRIEWLAEDGSQPPFIPPGELDLTVASPLRSALTRPPHAIDLWRERTFELIVDSEWVSGTFDRVVFTEDQGRRRAEIFDFKTNRPRSGEAESDFSRRLSETYAPQMSGYRRALACLSGLPPSDIACTLLLTETRQRVSL